MNATKQARQDFGFALGLMAGTVFGAGVAMWLAPGSASAIHKRTQRPTSTPVAEPVDEVARRSQDARNADAIAQRTDEFERYAMAARR